MSTPAPVTFREAVRVWAYIGVNSFGGPAGQISVMHRELVDRRRWIDEPRFLHALNFSMLLPGPEAMQLATYLGWLLHGVRGGIAAGLLFIAPGVAVMMALSAIYVTWGEVDWIAGLLVGLQSAVIALVVAAIVRLSRRSLTTGFLRGVAVASFVAIALLTVPFPAIVVGAGLLGWLVGRGRAGWLADPSARAVGHAIEDDSPDDPPPAPRQARGALVAAGVGLALWLVPVALLFLALGSANVFTQLALLFSKAAVVTFGGAYAVLAYVAQQAVGDYGWITAADMTVGLGLAETTPGPLILVVQFVGFLAAFGDPGALSPLTAGLAGAVLVVWVTFLPCFVFIFAGAPYVERLRHSALLRHALAGIGAAVVGVIASLALFFALATLVGEVGQWSWGPIRLPLPDLVTVQWVPLAITAIACLLVLRWRVSTVAVLAACAALGAVSGVVGLA